jgi:hypothetical protein
VTQGLRRSIRAIDDMVERLLDLRLTLLGELKGEVEAADEVERPRPIYPSGGRYQTLTEKELRERLMQLRQPKVKTDTGKVVFEQPPEPAGADLELIDAARRKALKLGKQAGVFQ